jgi:outer membrane protein
MRLAPVLMVSAAMTSAFLSGGGLALAQPASTAGTEIGAAPSQRTTYTVGVGVGMAPDYEGSNHYEIVPLWNLRVNNLYDPNTFVQLIGPRLRSNFLPDPHWRLGVDAQYIKERDHHVHDSKVSDLNSVDPSVMLGVIAGYDFLADPRQDLALEIEARQDVANGNGALVTLRGVYGTPLSESWRIDTSVGGTWASDDYMSAYFGIDSADAARSGLKQYNADAGFENVAFGGSLTYRISENWSASGLATYTRLVGDAADSPVVKDRGDENQLFGGALVNYRF